MATTQRGVSKSPIPTIRCLGFAHLTLLGFTKDESEEGSEAAEDDGVPLQLDLHPDDGEGGRSHA